MNVMKILVCGCALVGVLALIGCSQSSGSASTASSANSASGAAASSVSTAGASQSEQTSGSASASSSNSKKANIITADDVLARDDDTYLVDTRTADEFAAGHIPGSLNASYPKETGGACAAEQNAASFRTNWAKLDIPKDAHIMLYCRTGIRATSAATALFEDGYTNIDLYEGSWTDWTTDPSRPVETS